MPTVPIVRDDRELILPNHKHQYHHRRHDRTDVNTNCKYAVCKDHTATCRLCGHITGNRSAQQTIAAAAEIYPEDIINGVSGSR